MTFTNIHIRCCTNENCSHYLNLLDCITYVDKFMYRGVELRGDNLLQGLPLLTPRLEHLNNGINGDKFLSEIKSKSDLSSENNFHAKLQPQPPPAALPSSSPYSTFSNLNSQESLRLCIAQENNNDMNPRCIITPIDTVSTCSEALRFDLSRNAFKSTPNDTPPINDSGDYDDDGDDDQECNRSSSTPGRDKDDTREPLSVFQVWRTDTGMEAYGHRSWCFQMMTFNE
uniref:Uncharacterized protein n=1 Tax=Trichobilharzia regenti TaxID=157069 RepID=A0AA85K3T1_TRIRE|nr:unnamed protein product [Trichobilharzia regenti]